MVSNDSSLSTNKNLRIVIASAISSIHPGAGRSPGIVDLPVIRDPMGYFYIPGSELKGALKTSAAIRHKDGCINGDKINCKECQLVCCLLGGEVGEGHEAPSRLSVGDLYPLLIPVPSLSHGFLYATSPLLISRAKALINVASQDNIGKLIEWLETGVKELEYETDVVLMGAENSGQLYLTLTRVQPKNVAEKLENDVIDILENIHPVYRLHNLNGNTVIVSDALLPMIIERALIRLTRVRLSRTTKTVTTGSLWTEEYIPHITLFVGYIADTKYEGKYCGNRDIQDAVNELKNIMGASDNIINLVIGGKESIGKGLLRLYIA
ncbi:type III-B CRISPR module RAMP protein Cmr4 [Pyrodictium abyssi]|uniref:type III-B CRISPR module RAMP protein Cmr4 n=1 Tax=Pyrodictium abyssi TaxID=54256 RepID=UPI0030C68F6B